jgi:recombination protein RecA
VLDLAAEGEVVEKSGAWFSFQGERIGQGRENARTYLEQHPEMLDKIEQLLLAKHGVIRGPVVVATGTEPVSAKAAASATASAAGSRDAASPSKAAGPAARDPNARGGVEVRSGAKPSAN